ncbi:putative v-SNARE protein Bos1 [Nadsonia fulvescens var. elongata DSM 6958]|uniref:Protein transport protein BOS1 n=1 Tax=Nadsonia fulvescens var. elongata DSM 6958 TaxID=857566 RepID=A0A1E3PNR6_9ASCO|nr:putative v-SNARE protein Bos1 [Nadsonia fulvescens var. elongata DSM 6958]
MNSVFNHAIRQTQSLKRELDSFRAAPSSAPLSLQGQIAATLQSLQRTVDEYGELVGKELSRDRQEKGRVRLDNFRHEISAAKEQFKQLKLQREEATFNERRSELLERRQFQSSTPDNPYDSSHNQDTSNNSHNPSTVNKMDGLLGENSALHRSGQQLDDFLERGRAVLGDLAEQRDILNRTQTKIRSVANTLGISNETIRLVERRARQDKWVFYGGVFLMLLSFYYILRWLS